MSSSRTADLVADAINATGKTQREISAATGFARPNVISMLKSGQMRLPIERIPAFAEATGIDPAQLLDTAMTEYMPEAWLAIQSVLKFQLSQIDGSEAKPKRERHPNSD